jgi:MarR family 2-MHQ and catechol resistance regulon transcriptional repressor
VVFLLYKEVKEKPMYSEKEQRNMKMIIALSRTMQIINKKQAKLINEYGLTMPQFGVLEILYHKGPLCINDIIEKTLSTSGNMTVVIENLRKDGYIKKKRAPEDQRKFMISLTDKGKNIISRIFPLHLKNLGKIFEKYSERDKEVLLNLLEVFKK